MVLCFLGLLLTAHGQTPQTPDDARKSSGQEGDKAPNEGKNSVSMPSCYYMPWPPYTKEARDAKFEGTVLAEGIITVDGNVTSLRIVKSPGLGLDESVIKTLSTWKCKPAVREGKPIPVQIPFEIMFRLYEKK